MCTELPDDVERFLGSLVAFAEARDDVRAVALVGSHARGVARPDSDVDVVMLTTEPEAYIDGCDWIEWFPLRSTPRSPTSTSSIARFVNPMSAGPIPRPGRERFFRRERDLWVLAVVDFEGVPAIIVTVFSTERAPI